MKKPLIQLIVSFVVLILLIGAYGVWFVAVDTENAKARELAGEIQTKSQDATRIAEAKAALAALSNDESSVNSHFVSNNSVVPFLGDLETTGSALGSKVNVVSVSADTPSPGQQGHLQLSVEIDGTFNAVLRTLGAFEYAPYDITLTNLTLDSSAGNVWSADTSLSVGTGPAGTSTPATH